MRGDAAGELSNLVNETENASFKGSDQVRVRGCASVGKVVVEEKRRVVLGNEVVDPVQGAAGCIARERRVAQRVRGAWQRPSGDIESGL